MPRKEISYETAAAIRKEYCDNPRTTFEYLADKYDLSSGSVGRIVGNKIYPDPDYTKPTRKAGGPGPGKKLVYLPDHILEAKESSIPPTLALRARGQKTDVKIFS